jgi:transposase
MPRPPRRFCLDYQPTAPAVGRTSTSIAVLSLLTSIRQYLIPFVEENVGPLSAKEASFVRAAELAGFDAFLRAHLWRGNGRRPMLRKPLMLAFLAKAVWNLPTTRALLDFLRANGTVRTLCGWETAAGVPSEATFSRAFAAFAEDRLPERVHAAMVEAAMGGRLVGHASIDSTEIDGRERAAPKPKERKSAGGRRRGPKKGQRGRLSPPRRLELQPGRALAENLADLPTACDRGGKRGSSGMRWWKGYKLHMAVADGGVPVAALLSSASLHDSQAAIPLMQMAGERADVLYCLADSAYDADRIAAFARSRGHVPIIEPSARRTGKPGLGPAERARFKERTTVERSFSDLKDNLGGRSVRVRGALKVMAHLMFGVIALTAAQLVRLLE